MAASPQDTSMPWAPEDLPVAATALRAHWHYVVLEEIVDGVALFRRWAWPSVDQLGHLVWPTSDEHATWAATIDIADLRAQVYEPNGIQRHPRCGDTFAMTATVNDVWRRGRHTDNARTLFGDWVYDISADAREAAKIAYQGSLAPVAPEEATDDTVRVQQAIVLDERRQQPLRQLEIAASREPQSHQRGAR